MARIPLVTEYKPKGLNKLVKDFKRLETRGQKFTFAMQKAFVPATAGLAALGAAATKFINAGEEAATSNARIRQVADSMGLFGDQTAAVTDKLVKQANATARLTGVDQNQIKASQALLLTFGELAASADATGGAFDRATQLTIDMAAAGFGSATDNAKQLGKALNDPIKGISALSRSGITFTDQQKEQIRTLVESGRQFEAQDMILKAIERQVGGTAEATANSTDKLRVGFSQMAESVGMALLPLVEKIVPVLIGLFEFMGDNTGLIIGLAAAFGTLAGAVVAVNAIMKVYKAVMLIAKGVTLAFNLVVMLNPIGLVVIKVGALIALFVVLQKKFNIIGLAIKAFKKAFEIAWKAIKKYINNIIDGLNAVIDLLNKIPGVDIPGIRKIGEDAERSAHSLGLLLGEAIKLNAVMDQSREPMGRFETSVRNIERESSEFATTLGRVNVELDPLNNGIETATTRLDEFYDALDDKEATQKFVEDMKDIREALEKTAPGSQEFIDLQNEQHQAIRDLRREREDLSDAFIEALHIRVDSGDLETIKSVETLLGNLVDLGGFEIPVNFNVGDFNLPGMPTFAGSSAEVRFESALASAEFGARGVNVTVGDIIVPAGTTGEDITEGLINYQRFNGAVPLVVDGSTFR